MDWTVYGKIKAITKTDGPNINYNYDPAGQRASKVSNGLTTWYVRDASGNTMAIYDNKGGTTNWREQDLYGSSRLGIWTPNVNLANNNASTVWDTIGHKQYELTNHLGNVLATITDKRIPVSGSGSTIAYYLPDPVTAQLYYSFGAIMPSMNGSPNNYRYGFNGKENDNEVKQDASGADIAGAEQDYGMRIYDPRVGRFLSVDPLSESFPEYSSYQYAGNSTIANIDLDGAEEYYYNATKIDGKLKLTLTKTVETKSFLGFSYTPPASAFVHYLNNDENYWFSLDPKKISTAYNNTSVWEHVIKTGDIESAQSKTQWVSGLVSYGLISLMAHTANSSRAHLQTNSEANVRPELELTTQSLKPESQQQQAVSVKRPTALQSEQELVPPDATPQVSFKNGKRASYGSAGSVRPDGYNTSEAISTEIKNYNVTTQRGRTSLVNNIVKQVRQRLSNLPKGTQQNVIIDTRGQTVTQSTLNNIRNNITTQAGSQNVNVQFKTN